MVNKIFATTLLAALVSSTFAAEQQYETPEVWECDAPGTDGFFLSDEEVPFDSANDACAQSGGVLADISNRNFLFSSDLVRNCVGENENTWIRSWDYNPTNPQERRCLALYVGFTGPGGGIDIECEGNRYALCMTAGKRMHSSPNIKNIGNGLVRTVTVTETETVRFQSVLPPTILYSDYYRSYDGSSSPSISVEDFTHYYNIAPQSTFTSYFAIPSPTLDNSFFLVDAPQQSEPETSVSAAVSSSA